MSTELDQDQYSLEAIELIDFCLQTLKLGAEQGRQVDQFGEHIKPILSILLSGEGKLSNQMVNLENSLPALQLIENILKLIEKEGNIYEDIEFLKTSVKSFNDFYVKMCQLFKNEELVYDEFLKLRLDVFKKSGEILRKIQKYSYSYDQKQMPEWLNMVIECSKIKKAKIVLISIETFLNILSKSWDN